MRVRMSYSRRGLVAMQHDYICVLQLFLAKKTQRTRDACLPQQWRCRLPTLNADMLVNAEDGTVSPAKRLHRA